MHTEVVHQSEISLVYSFSSFFLFLSSFLLQYHGIRSVEIVD